MNCDNTCKGDIKALDFGQRIGCPPILRKTGEKNILEKYRSLIGYKAIEIQEYSLKNDLSDFLEGLFEFIKHQGSGPIRSGFTVLCYYNNIKSVEDLEDMFNGYEDIGLLHMIPKVGNKLISIILVKIYLDRNKNRRSEAIRELKIACREISDSDIKGRLSIPVVNENTVSSLLKLIQTSQ